MQSLARHFEEGNWGMWPILACSIVAVSYGLAGIARLWAPRVNARRLIEALEQALAFGDVDAAVMLVAPPRVGAERIVLAGLRESLQPIPRIEAAVASALLIELPRLRRGQGALRTTTQLATLFGLYGTITGLAMPFGLCNVDEMSRACALAHAISMSMNCTAFGLFVSTLSLALGFVIEARAAMLTKELELVACATANRLVTHRSELRWLGARVVNERPTYRDAA